MHPSVLCGIQGNQTKVAAKVAESFTPITPAASFLEKTESECSLVESPILPQMDQLSTDTDQCSIASRSLFPGPCLMDWKRCANGGSKDLDPAPGYMMFCRKCNVLFCPECYDEDNTCGHDEFLEAKWQK